MTEKKITQIARRTTKTIAGDLDVSILSDGEVHLTEFSHHGMITRYLTREQAMQLSKNIEDVIAEYDAGCDEYVGDE